MKTNRVISRHRGLLVLYAISIVYSLYLLTLTIGTTNDTESYFKAWDVIATGGIDDTRTPLYPTFVGVISALGGGYKAIVFWQLATFNVSVYFFYQLAAILCRKPRIVNIVTLIYILSPQTAQWGGVLLTESLSVSLSVIWLYTMVRIVHDGCRGGVVTAYTLLLTALLMLRPALAYLLLASGVLCLCYWGKWGRFVVMGIATAIPAIVLLSYCGAYCGAYGVFTPTRVGDINNAVIMKLNHEKIDTRCLTDEAQRADWEYYLHQDTLNYDGYSRLQDIYGIEGMHQAVSTLGSHNRWANAKHVVVRLSWMLAESRTTSIQPMTPINIILCLICLTGKEILGLAIIYLAFVIWLWRKGAKVMLPALLIVIVISCIAINVVGAQSSYIRLSTAIVPILMLGMAQIVSHLRIQANPDK